jgi:hypothetical protein
MAASPTRIDEDPQPCEGCGIPMQSMARRTVWQGLERSYLLEIWMCATCRAAAPSLTQDDLPATRGLDPAGTLG